MTNDAHFRAGVGMVLYQHKSIYTFNRTDLPHVWQFPQGGIDVNEPIENALWRELFEETAITRDQVATVTPFPHWLYYEYPNEVQAKFATQPAPLGQIHRWFFLDLKLDTIIDISQATDKEFLTTNISTFPDLLEHTRAINGMKLPVYQALAEFFEKHIVNRQ